MNDTQQKEAAKQFASYWKGKGYEKGESQAFWLSLLRGSTLGFGKLSIISACLLIMELNSHADVGFSASSRDLLSFLISDQCLPLHHF